MFGNTDSQQTQDMLDIALHYAARGWWVLPLQNRGKKPRTGHGFHDASNEIAQIEAWWTQWPQANVGIATGKSGLVVVDADGKEGLAALHTLMPEGMPKTLWATTGREHGVHIYFAGSCPSTQDKEAHLDIRGDTGYVVAPGSIHPNGRVYAWGEQCPIAPVPQEIVEWVGVKPQDAALGPKPEHLQGRAQRDLARAALAGLQEHPFSPEEAKRLFTALSVIPPDIDGKTWFAYGGALHDLHWIVAGVDIGFEMWDQWSSTSKGKGPGKGEYKGRADLEKRWVGFAKPKSGPRVTIASIFAKAKELGWEDVNGVPFLPPELEATKSASPLIKLNERHAVIEDVGSKCLVLSWINSHVDPSVKVPSLQSFKSFAERYANQYVKIKSKDKKGQTVEEPKQLGSYWLKWPKRKSYQAIDLVPNSERVLPGNVLNLWRGFAIEPVAGTWELMKWHIGHTLAQGNLQAAEYIIRWAAWACQHADEPAEVALVLKGGKGTGKSTFGNAMRRLFGAHGMQVYTSRHLTGNFNAHLRSCLLLFADEAFWAGDKQGESTLKALLTESTVIIEQKGIDATAWKNRLHVIMAANADWVVPASHDERRFAVFELGEKPDEPFFRALYDEMNAGGLAAMLHDLLHLDLQGWHPRQIVRTEALQKQKEWSLSPLAAWWEGVLQDGVMAFHAPGTPEQAWAVDILENVKSCGIDARHGGTKQALGRFLRTIGDGIHKREGTLWTFPELDLARKAWVDKMGGWQWDDESALKWLDKLGERKNTSHSSHIVTP